MNKILASVAIFSICSSALLANEGADLYKKCIACHGAKAEKPYLNKVPALNTLDKDSRLEELRAYKEGKLNKINMGPVMRMHMMSLSDEDIVKVNDYIETLKQK